MNKTAMETPNSKHRRVSFALSLVALLTYILIFINVNQDDVGSTASLKAMHNSSTILGDSTRSHITKKKLAPAENCTSMCAARLVQHRNKWGGDLLDFNDLERLARNAHKKLIERLKQEYGKDNFANIFEGGNSRIRKAFVSANPAKGISTDRFKRKLKMKVLMMQESVRQDLESCDCNGGALETSVRRLGKDRTSPQPKHYARFVWATGGHSAAAGHGNLWNQSYTAIMEQAVGDVFGAIGIDFEGRNYAMGGTHCAPEIALCSEAIFGTDADVISSDFGMTDGVKLIDRTGMYANRAGLNPNRPAIVHLFLSSRLLQRKTDELRKVEDRGLTALYLDPDAWKEMTNSVPETFGLTTEQIETMPRMVRHFKCQDILEKGDPTCGENKFDNDLICPKRRYATSWHPGWKFMALTGYMMALFLCDTLLEAISELKGSPLSQTILQSQLTSQEDADYEKFFGSKVPDLHRDFMKKIDNKLMKEANATVFYRSPSICHTARLPAESRYLGILTESAQTGVKTYYKGQALRDAKNIETDGDRSSPMPLVYDESEREKCDVELTRDYKDFFFLSNRMGWRSLTVPNKAEIQAYGRESTKQLGILLVCLTSCPWQICPNGNLAMKEVMNGEVKFEVNGEEVDGFSKLDDCFALRGKNGHFWTPNEDGHYVVNAKIPSDTSELSYLRISSIIVL